MSFLSTMKASAVIAPTLTPPIDPPSKPKPLTKEELLKIGSPSRKLLTTARQNFIRKGIEGSVEYEIVAGFLTSGLSLDITAEDIEEASKQTGESDGGIDTETQDDNPLIKALKTAAPGIDGAIERMCLQSLEWRDVPFAKNVTLSEGFSIEDPVVGAFGITFKLSASMASILSYAERNGH